MNDVLFSKLDGYAVIENQKRQLRDSIASAPEKLTELPDENVVDQFVQRFSINVPRLDEPAMQTSEKEIDIDVSRDPRRMFFDEHPDGFYMKGTEITIHIPFVGEGILFDVQQNMFSTSMPRGQVVGQELLLSFRFAHDSPPTNLRSALESRLAEIRQYLSRLEEMANTLNGELRSIAIQAWHSRRAQFAQRQSIVSGLGLPIKQTVMQTARRLVL